MRKEALVVAAIALIALILSPVGLLATPKGGDWTNFILNPQDTRYQSSSTVNSTNVTHLKLGWFFPTGGSVTSTPIVANGNVYFNDWNGTTYSVNLATGTQNWADHLTNGYWISTTPLYANGLLYVAGGVPGVKDVHPWIFALAPSTGKVTWSSALPDNMGTVFASPTYYNGIVYIGEGGCGGEGTNSSCKGGMYALNANTGALVWSFMTGGSDGGASVWSTAIVDTSLNAIYFGTGYNYLISNPETFPTMTGSVTPFGSYGFTYTGTVTSLGTFGFSYSILSVNAATGALNWADQLYTNKTSAGDVDCGSTGNLFTVAMSSVTYKALGYACKDGNYYVIDRTNGNLLAKDNVYPATSGGGMIGVPGFYYQTQSPVVVIPAYYGSNTTTGCCGIIAELTPGTGAFAWKVIGTSTSGPSGKVIGSVAVASGVAFFGDDAGNLFGVSTSTGKTLWYQKLSNGINGGVTIAEGHVLVGTSSCKPLCQFQTGMGLYAYDVLPFPTLALTPTPSTVTLGQPSSASVTISLGTSPSGTVKFTAYSSSTCSSSSQVSTSTVTVSGNGAYSSSSFTPTTTGTYYWTAAYSGDANNNPSSTTCNAAGTTTTVSSIPKVTSFSYSLAPTSNDPTLRSGTITFTFVIQNFGTAAVTLGGSASVSGTASLTCTGGNSLTLSGSVAAGASATFSLVCTYSGVAGQAASATVGATFTDVNSVLGTVSGSPASLQYSL